MNRIWSIIPTNRCNGANNVLDQVRNVGSIRSDPSQFWEGFDTFFNDHEFVKTIEIGWTTAQDRIYLDNLHLTLWHGQLRFDEPTEAHIAISVGGQLLWEKLVEIPNAGGIYDITIPATIDAPAGAPVEFHLHNHGYNTWTLLQLEVER